ncbi:neurofilament heavy polypeptide [Drosophila takahashii]|uniref:neurofilament heavy polypeptide n=1 Tax=Drosophila takahashii TaxID=29030 RepID=UPI0038991E84
MSDENKKENLKDASTGTEKIKKSSKDANNTERSSVSFNERDEENKEPPSSISLKQGPKVAPKPKKSALSKSSSQDGKDADEKPGFSKSFEKESKGSPAITKEIEIAEDDSKTLVQSIPGKVLLKESEAVKPQNSRDFQKYPSSDKVNEIPSTRRVREPFDSFDREEYLAELIDYDRSSEDQKQDKKQTWEPDNVLRRRLPSEHEFNSTSSLKGEEEEIDSIGSATMRGSYRDRSQKADDDRGVILAEVINMGRLKELKNERESSMDFLKQPRVDRSIDEIRGAQTTGTSRHHVEEINYRENSSDDDDNEPVKHKGTITKLFCLTQKRVEEKETPKEDEEPKVTEEKKPPPKQEIELEAKKPWSFPITETFSEIPGEQQPLRENQKVKLGKRSRKIRSIGINTDISRKSGRPKVTTYDKETDLGVYHDGGRLRDIGQVTERLSKSRKNYKYKTEPEDGPIEIGPSIDNQKREIGVNTKILPKTKDPPISGEHTHKGDRFRDFGTNTDKPFLPIDDGTKVIYMEPIKSDENKLNKLIVDPPLDNGPYKMPTKEDRRSYYEGCEYHFPGRTGWRRLFYNRTHGKYELRRCNHWVYTLIFALLYISFVILFSMAWFDYVTDEVTTKKAPTTKMVQPTITFAPIGPRTNPKTISFDPRNNTEVMEKYASIMALLEKYGDTGKNLRFGTCNAYEKFGYPSGTPCIFLKVNRIIGFKTEPYSNSDDLVNAKLGENDFNDLKGLLDNSTSNNRTWFTCRTDTDTNVQIEFHPEPSIQTEFTDIKEKIEFVGDKGKKSFFSSNDLNRIVALKIQNLKANERVHVNCKMWARNIHHKHEGYGQVAFYVLLATDKNRERVEKVLRHHDSL